MNEINNYLQKTLKVMAHGSRAFQGVRPRIICNDGESVSIQAGIFLYSTPREDGLKSYSAIEAGFPSVIPPLSWKEYSEEWEIGFGESLKNLLRALFNNKISSLRKIYWRQLINPMPTQTVYPFMPIETAQEFIDAHGGIDWDKSLEEN